MINLFLADDHPIVLQGIRQMLSNCDDIRIVGEASNGSELLDNLKKTACDVLIMDIKMPDRNGIELLQQIRQDYPELPVLIFSMFPEEQYGPRYLRLGASGYLSKAAAPVELINAVRRIADGYKYISPALAEVLLDDLEIGHPEAPHKVLSDREFEILRKIVVGKKINEIAAELCISASTVRTYKGRILKKMKINNEAELVRYALYHHLIE
jgi:two-component system invasion response regulator UvrY